MSDLSPTSSAHHILIVDDDETNLDVLQRRLQRKEYQVTLANDGQEAIDAVEANPGGYDLILLDVMMPGIDGIGALEILRETYSSSELPIIMVTAKGESEDVVKALQVGANDYITKPIDFPVLFARMKTHLKLVKTHRKLVAAQHSMITGSQMESIGQIATEVADEVQSPLAQLHESVESLGLSSKVQEDGDLSQLAESMAVALRRTDEVLQNLTRFAAGRQIEPKPAQLNAVTSNCLSLLSEVLDTPLLDLQLELSEDLPDVSVDRDQIEKAVLNMLAGALQTVSGGGKLEIRTRTRELALEESVLGAGAELPVGSRVAELQIVDTGPSISDEQMGHLYDGDPTERGGLGLVLTKHVVERHGGRISLQNCSDTGCGVKATLWLPL